MIRQTYSLNGVTVSRVDDQDGKGAPTLVVELRIPAVQPEAIVLNAHQAKDLLQMLQHVVR